MNARGLLRPSGVGHIQSGADEEAVVYVARVPRGPLLVLAGTAGLIWRAVASELTPDQPVLEERLLEVIAEDVGLAVDDVRADAVRLFCELVDHGVLVRTP